MQYTTLGRTGLEVSVAGLGCGGHSRLGQSYGASEADSIAVIHAALDLGINFVDTAAAYGTEPIVGQALRGRRDKAVLCTKQHVIKPGTPQLGHDYHTADSFTAAFEESLQKLQTDHVDVMHLHGVMPDQYDHALNELVPALQRLREAGKVRFFGLTERFIHDPQHAMLQRALDDDWIDVVMTGFSLINPSARARVLAKTREKNIGTLIMFAVRRALSQPEALRELLDKLSADGLVDGAALDRDDPLGFLVAEGGAASVIDGAYRFCRHEPGADVILTGTGKVAHLAENVGSITAGPLAAPCLEHLQALFGAVDSVSGE
jgi:aryl-alcohol dehydrogenase-like predicted oxidoreductase